MRLWHQSLIPYLDNKRLLGQHRECCALRGKGWTKKHSTIDYIKKYDLGHLYCYHLEVMCEMSKRNYFPNSNWLLRIYRGKNMPIAALAEVGTYVAHRQDTNAIYPEHDDSYLKECLLNLKAKGAELINGKTIEQMLVDLDMKNVG